MSAHVFTVEASHEPGMWNADSVTEFGFSFQTKAEAEAYCKTRNDGGRHIDALNAAIRVMPPGASW